MSTTDRAATGQWSDVAGHLDRARSDLITPAGTEPTRPEPVGYESRFDGWFARASIRSRPQRVLLPGEYLYFTPELAPWATHPLVAGQGEAAVRRVLIRRLYDYLHFTIELEQLAVIPIATAIARGRSGLDLPAGMRSDAYKIVTDEAWHAQFSFDLLEQVEAATGIRRRQPVLPAFVGRLDRIREQLDPGTRGLEGLLFSIVSETLISAILADLPRDPRLPPRSGNWCSTTRRTRGATILTFETCCSTCGRSYQPSSGARSGRGSRRWWRPSCFRTPPRCATNSPMPACPTRSATKSLTSRSRWSWPAVMSAPRRGPRSGISAKSARYAMAGRGTLSWQPE